MPVSIVRFTVFLGAVFLIGATLAAGRVAFTSSDWTWLPWGGLATLAVAWLVSLLPATGSTTVVERQP